MTSGQWSGNGLRTVLLARPHRFIVEEMRQVLQRNGFRPMLPGQAGHASLSAPELRGAIISTALQSGVPDAHLDTYEQLTSARPDLPVVFATMAPADRYVGLLQAALGRRSGDVKVLRLTDLANPRWPGRRDGDVLLLDKADVVEGGAILDRALQGWFS